MVTLLRDGNQSTANQKHLLSERRRTSATILEFLYSDLTLLALPASGIPISLYSNRSVLANEKNLQRFESFRKKN